MKNLIEAIKAKNLKDLSVRELSILTRYTNLSKTMEEEAVLEKLENELNLAKDLRKNSIANTTTDAGAAAELVPENVMISNLIDLGNASEDYGFLTALVGKHTLVAKKTTVPVVGRAKKARVMDEMTSTSKFREAKEGLQSAGTSKVEIEAKKLYNNELLTDELSTFSIIELDALFLGKLQDGILLAAADGIINGDSSDTTTNVNNKGEAPSTTYGAGWDTFSEYKFDGGLRKKCLAGAENVTKKNIGVLTGVDNIIDIQALVTSTNNPQKKIVLMDSATYYTLMKKDDFKNAAKNGVASTIYKGAVTNMGGSDIFVTGLIKKAGTDGLVSKTPAENVTGTIIVLDVSCPQFGDYDSVKFNAENDFAISKLLEAYGYWGNTNMVTADGLVFAGIGYNCTAQ